MTAKERRSSMKHPICPACSTEYVIRVSRERIVELIMSVFYVYPFRCQLCGCRFSAFQWGVRYLRIEEDRREYQRLPASFPVLFGSDKLDSKGWITDISMSGCTVQSESKIASQIVSMSLMIPNEKLPVRVKAAVVRTMELNRIGLEFLKFESTEKARLRLFIRGLLQAPHAAAETTESSTAAA